MSSAAQIAANRANAQLSTGPNTESGKANSSLNAVNTGLTGRTVLLPSDAAALYQAHVSEVTARFTPATEQERLLVQSIADTEWRLARIPSLEMGIYAVGRLEFAQFFANEAPDVRNHLIDAQVFLSYQRQLNNLSIQESRLRRQREKDLAALRCAQEQRTCAEKASSRAAAVKSTQVVRHTRQLQNDPAESGFVFSNAVTEAQSLDIDRDPMYGDSRERPEVA
ncbi:MAG: hypothetical protein JO217_08735 [Acidobacteriaceae bacterium]|nr:hypothetical protein [Acidobacteriaceae bacterium]MBV9442765.1 hypothetical protein [Acidobacteriaceae bacterium]